LNRRLTLGLDRDHALAGQLCGTGEAGLDILASERRICGEYVVNGVAMRHVLNDQPDHDSGPTDAGLAVADPGIDRDAAQELRGWVFILSMVPPRLLLLPCYDID
jgi:hypothetical protein